VYMSDENAEANGDDNGLSRMDVYRVGAPETQHNFSVNIISCLFNRSQQNATLNIKT